MPFHWAPPPPTEISRRILQLNKGFLLFAPQRSRWPRAVDMRSIAQESKGPERQRSVYTGAGRVVLGHQEVKAFRAISEW